MLKNFFMNSIPENITIMCNEGKPQHCVTFATLKELQCLIASKATNRYELVPLEQLLPLVIGTRLSFVSADELMQSLFISLMKLSITAVDSATNRKGFIEALKYFPRILLSPN